MERLANPSLKGLRFSMADYQEQDWMTNIPLYAVSELARWLCPSFLSLN